MTIPKKVREALRERSSGYPEYGRCEICGFQATNAHHRRNKSQGGRDVLSNLLMLCGSGTTGHHGDVTMHPEWAARCGYTIRNGEDTTKPVLLYRFDPDRETQLAVLGDDGTVEPVA